MGAPLPVLERRCPKFSKGDERLLRGKQQDFRALGLLMVQLMEWGTSLRSPDSFTLQDPNKWEEPIKSFLQKTQPATGEELQKVNQMRGAFYR